MKYSPLMFSLALLAPPLLIAPQRVQAQAHEFNCAARDGIERARCERHEKMFTACGDIKGEAHFVCDREFLLAHPLRCSALTGEDNKRCEGEVAAFKTCAPQQGREFMRCVRDEIKASPMGKT